MKRIDLDELPPRAAALLEGLEAGDELLLTRAGLVVGRLIAAERTAATDRAEAPLDAEDMKEVLEQFDAMIHDAF